ncbi:hypothetical protein BDW69DRAFT_157281 [Aspergillus filifer]
MGKKGEPQSWETSPVRLAFLIPNEGERSTVGDFRRSVRLGSVLFFTTITVPPG